MFLLLAISCIMLPNSTQQGIVGYVTPIGEEMEALWVPSP